MLISQPDVTFNILPAQRDVSNAAPRVLIIGQKTASGTATSGVVTENVGNDRQEDALFGITSHLASMIRQFRRINPITIIDAVPYSDNGSGVAATGTIAFTGPATATGTMYVTVGSDYDHKYSITVTSADTATTIGAAVAAAITADTKAQFTAASVTGTVTVTAIHKGTIGNQIALKVTDIPTGVGVTITAMASGATNPTITGLEAAIDGVRYNTIIYPGTYALATLDTLLDNRLNVTNNVLDGVAVITKTDTYANLLTYVNTLNQPLIIAFGNPKVAVAGRLTGGAILEFDDNISAQVGAIRTLRLTQDANITGYVIGNNGQKDIFGGPHTASLPFFNTPFKYLPVIKQGDGFTRTQIEALQLVGVSVLGNNISRSSIISGEVVTTYLTDVAGNADSSFKYVEYVDTISQVREYFYNNTRAQYAQCRLTDGPLVPGYNAANADSIKAYLAGLYLDLAGDGYFLTRLGEANFKYFKDNLVVTLDLETGTVTASMIVPIVVQLRTILATIRVAFNTNA